MKKIATLIAGIMLVGGMAFAGNMTVNGKVEHTVWNANSDGNALENGGDQYFMLNLTKQLDETTKVTLGYDTDDENPDMVGSLLLTKQVNDQIEAQVSIDVDTTTGMSLTENNGGDTYIKFSPSDVLTVTLKPFEAGTGIGDEFETAGTQDAGGVEVSFGAADAPLTLSGAVNFDNGYTDDDGVEQKYENEDGGNYDAIALKGAATFTGVENLSVTGELSLNTQADDGTNANSKTKMAFDARACYTMGDLTLKGELLSVILNKTVGDKKDESGLGLFTEVVYSLGEITSGITASVNGSFKNLGEFFYFDDDDDSYENLEHGGLNIIGTGVDFNWKGLTIENSLEMRMAENEIFEDKDGKDTDFQTTFETVVSVEF